MQCNLSEVRRYIGESEIAFIGLSVNAVGLVGLLVQSPRPESGEESVADMS